MWPGPFSLGPINLQLLADLPIKRLGAAAAQRDGKHDQAPHQRVLIARAGPAELGQVGCRSAAARGDCLIAGGSGPSMLGSGEA